MQTQELEHTLVTRTDRLPDHVELCTLKPGDEFESEFSGGKVAWSINKGYSKAVAVIFDGHTSEVSIAPTLKVRVRKRADADDDTPATPLVVEPAKPAYIPVGSSPVIHIIRLDDPAPAVKPATALPVCKFDLTLNDQQIRLLHFSCLSDMFYYGLYHSWTKETFFAVASAKFPTNKAGQDVPACNRQINLYRALLRRAGKLG